MRKRSLGLLILAGVVGLAVVALRERPAPSRSVPRSAPEATDTEAPAQTAAGDESEPGEGTLWGTVVVPEGIDVAEVRIGIATKLGEYRASKTGVANFRESLEVGRDGTFRREGLPLGEYDLVARHPSCATCRMKFELRPGRGTGPLHVVLRPGSLLVRIVGAGGRGLGGEHVALHRGEGTPEHIEYRLEPARPQVGEGFTDADGEIRFANLDSGTYTLTRRGTIIEQRSATVLADHETVVLFDASASLFGTLFGHDGQPIPGAKLFLKASGGRIYETRTDERGAFAVRGIAAGEYGVTASVKDVGSIPLVEPLVVEDGRTHEYELRLPAVRLAGLVVEAESGAPFTSRRVAVGASAFGLSFRAFARTGPDGRFELTGLYPGRYQISADPENLGDGFDQHASETVTVTPTPATQELVIRMPPGVAKTACLRLTVLDREGNPADQILFSIDGRLRLASEKGILRSRDANVVGPGVYDIPLTPGAHRIGVSTQLYGPWEEVGIELEAGQTAERAIALEKLLKNS